MILILSDPLGGVGVLICCVVIFALEVVSAIPASIILSQE